MNNYGKILTEFYITRVRSNPYPCYILIVNRQVKCNNLKSWIHRYTLSNVSPSVTAQP